MRKGFTLIEVLAVFALIGVVALVITPMGINVYNSAREKTVLMTAERLVEATDTYIKNYEIEYGKPLLNAILEIKNHEIENNPLELSGKLPQSGMIYIKDGSVAIVIYDSGICAYKNYNQGVATASSMIESECAYDKIFY